MAFGILSIIFTLAVFYFAFVGVQATVVKYRQEHAIEVIRDLLKYLVLFIAAVLTCLGLAGLLGLALDPKNVDYGGKVDAAQWLAYLVVGIPVIAVITNWIRKSFRKVPEERNSPAWQYLPEKKYCHHPRSWPEYQGFPGWLLADPENPVERS